ncbi:hypothetical protein ACFVWP_42270 [Streptomyces sp. NPDC058175]
MPGAVVRGLDHLVTRPDLMRLRLWSSSSAPPSSPTKKNPTPDR